MDLNGLGAGKKDPMGVGKDARAALSIVGIMVRQSGYLACLLHDREVLYQGSQNAATSVLPALESWACEVLSFDGMPVRNSHNMHP